LGEASVKVLEVIRGEHFSIEFNQGFKVLACFEPDVVGFCRAELPVAGVVEQMILKSSSFVGVPIHDSWSKVLISRNDDELVAGLESM